MNNRYLFIDMNAFFASVEQQERPELRGRPIIVAPVMTDSTCAIASSYEAKPFGIRTGTMVKDAKRLCPELVVVEGRPKLYRQYHDGIVEVLNAHFVEVKPLSVDEMACPVSRFYSGREAEERMARRVKRDLYDKLGTCLRASIGIAPNVFLAKVASDMQKPDGLTILDETNLPDALFGLELLALPGIGRSTHAHLVKRGIYSVRSLYEASPAELRRAWGSVTGERWHHMLRGSRQSDYESNCREVRKSVGHSHVLPPQYRTEAGARQILMRLLSKGLKRLRVYDQASATLHLHVSYFYDKSNGTYGTHGADMGALQSNNRPSGGFGKHSWDARATIPSPANDDITWGQRVGAVLATMPIPPPGYSPLRVGVTFTELISCADANLALFDCAVKRTRLCKTMDDLNARFGHVVDLASVYWQREQAPYRIPFGASLLDVPVS